MEVALCTGELLGLVPMCHSTQSPASLQNRRAPVGGGLGNLRSGMGIKGFPLRRDVRDDLWFSQMGNVPGMGMGTIPLLAKDFRDHRTDFLR